MNVFVTGASGFLGSGIVKQGKAAGLSVTATDRRPKAQFAGEHFIAGDILNFPGLSEALRGIDCVCHVAGLAHIFRMSPDIAGEFHSVNVAGTEKMARAAVNAHVPHFVFISSVSVYGGTAQGKDETSECCPEGPYAVSKLQAEQSLIELCQKERMNLTILRLATLYGEEDPGNVARLIGSIERGRFIWLGKGENRKSLLHRDDAARACLAAVCHPVDGINVYNVSASARKMKDVVEAIAFALGMDIPFWHVPANFTLNSAKILKSLSFNRGRLSRIHEKLQKWLADDYYDTDKFCNTFNFKARVSLEEGIKREVKWYRDSWMRGNDK
jgi:nucleoside-diphosphate-sugar epimerase